jgi:hypothetical protein
VASTVHEAGDREVRLEVRGAANGAPITADRSRIQDGFHAIFRAVLREQPAATVVVADRRLTEGGPAGRSAVVVVARDAYVQAAYDAPRAPFDEKRGGMGLALPIARRVVRAAGGEVWSPEPPGQASEPSRGAIVVALPVSPE